MKRSFLVGLLIVSGLAVLRLSAQALPGAQFTFDRTTAYIGEPVNLTLRAEFPTGSTVVWPSFPAVWPPFEIVNTSEVQITEQGSSQLYVQELSLISWQLGDLATAPVILTYSLPGASEFLQIEAIPAAITIQSVLVDGDTALRPLKPPVFMPAFPHWIFPVVLVVVVFVGVYFWRVKGWKLRLSSRVARPVSTPLPSQKAVAELERIQSQEASSRTVCMAVVNCVRAYLVERFYVPAALTTDEMVTYLHTGSAMSPELQRKLIALLRRADLARFAPPLPEPDLARQLTRAARQWINTVEAQGQAEDAV